MKTPKSHTHAELIKAWADGAKIQSRHLIDFDNVEQWSKWTDDDEPDWCDEDYQFRIKAEEPINEPWKPKEGEAYYFLVSTGTVGKDYYHSSLDCDKDRVEIGNYFRTKDEAEAAIPRVKTALKGELKISAQNVEIFQLDGKPLTDGEKALIRALRCSRICRFYEDFVVVEKHDNGVATHRPSLAFFTDTPYHDARIKYAIEHIQKEQEANREA